ncbi:MAG: SDR family oxidoreductase [Cyanobacteria bacterium P01_F01_bin.42]
MSTALVTGASSGIGAAFSEALAQKGSDLILVARSRPELEQMAERFQSEHGISAVVIEQDLVADQAVKSVVEQVEQAGCSIDLLINNAGFGDYGAFDVSDRQKQLGMIDLNIRALVEMTHALLPAMLQRGNGQIINVASIAGFQPMPYFSVYAATKAFVLSFSEAIGAENQSRGIQVLALCPGPTDSKFMTVAGFPDTMSGMEQTLVSSESVVNAALAALETGKSNVVTGGLINQMMVNSSRFMPRSWVVNGVKRIMSPS